MEGIKAAKYPPSGVPENRAISKLKDILDDPRIKAHINEYSTIPNWDGRIELTCDDQTPLGGFDVQVKILQKRFISNPKCQLEKQFLAYCYNAIPPIVLFVVDVENEKAYWVLMDRTFIDTLDFTKKTKTILVQLIKTNIIERKKYDYISSWVSIIEQNQKQYFEYPIVLEKMVELEKINAIMKTNSNPSLGTRKSDYAHIHRFLDELNYQFDYNFNYIKGLMSPGVWKYGIAYTNFSQSSIEYLIYPISQDLNDLQIKELDNNMANKLRTEYIHLSGYMDSNPLIENPEKHADSIVLERAMTILGQMKPIPIRNAILAREVLFSFVDHLFISLGLEKKDEYSISELLDSIHIYMPIWVDEVIKNKNILLGKRIFIDPETLIMQLSEEKRKQIDAAVRDRKDNGNIKTEKVLIGSETYPFKVIIDALYWLNSLGITKINRLYRPPNYERCKTHGNWIWSPYTRESSFENFNILYRNLPDAYDAILKTGFPSLYDKLNFYNSFNDLVIVFDATEDSNVVPGADFEYFNNKNYVGHRTRIYLKEDVEQLPWYISMKNDRINVPREGCTRIGGRSTAMDVLYHRYPIFDSVYRLLLERITKYFETNQASLEECMLTNVENS